MEARRDELESNDEPVTQVTGFIAPGSVSRAAPQRRRGAARPSASSASPGRHGQAGSLPLRETVDEAASPQPLPFGSRTASSAYTQ